MVIGIEINKIIVLRQGQYLSQEDKINQKHPYET